MSDEIQTGTEPAMPVSVSMSDNELYSSENIENGSGFTKRERAAIDLRVADSSTPWLDEMIEKSNRMELAKASLNGLLSNPGGPFQQSSKCGWSLVNCTMEGLAKVTLEMASEMLRAGKGS